MHTHCIYTCIAHTFTLHIHIYTTYIHILYTYTPRPHIYTHVHHIHTCIAHIPTLHTHTHTHTHTNIHTYTSYTHIHHIHTHPDPIYTQTYIAYTMYSTHTHTYIHINMHTQLWPWRQLIRTRALQLHPALSPCSRPQPTTAEAAQCVPTTSACSSPPSLPACRASLSQPRRIALLPQKAVPDSSHSVTTWLFCTSAEGIIFTRTRHG